MPSFAGATCGALAIDGVFQCYTLEDQLREQSGLSVAQWKVPGATAIPAGIYRVRLTFSQRFQRVLPLLEDVHGFTGVRIHPGNTIADTEGCILVGRTRGPASVSESRSAFVALLTRLDTHADDLWIDVINPPPIDERIA